MTAAVQAALTDDLRRAPWRGSTDPLAGHCYVASEALWHLLGQPADLKPAVVRHEGATHWFLRRADGSVVDLTHSQFTTEPPYAQARGCGFLTRQPSKRAQVVIDRCSAAR